MDNGSRVLVVDDEESVCQLLADLLETEGYQVRAAPDGRQGLREFYGWRPSLVVLDILMPGPDGWWLLDRIREVSEVPVIMLTALDQEQNKVRALRIGADDYMVKPIHIGEFLARTYAALRKSKASHDTGDAYDDAALHVDFQRHHVSLRGQPVHLSPQEFRILAALVRNPGVVLSADRLLNLCWKEGEGGPESLRVYIGHLRKKLEEAPGRPRLIETVREFGYRYRPLHG